MKVEREHMIEFDALLDRDDATLIKRGR